MKKRLTFVAIVPTLESRTRCLKMAKLAHGAGQEISFWGWDRDGKTQVTPVEDSICQDRKVLLKGGGFSNRKLLPYYIIWVLRVFWETLRRPPERVQALGLESAFPVAVASLFRRKVNLIFDDADRLSYCHSMPDLPRKLLASLERWTMRRCQIHLVPGRARYPEGLLEDRTVILKNTPSQDVLDASEAFHLTQPSVRGVLTLLGVGWIGDVRGASLMDRLAAHFENDNRLRFIAAGRLTGDAAERFAKRRNVEYFGQISNAKALSLYRCADFVMTLYDPRIRINRYAEPNKWGDCVSQRTPFIVNEEVKTAQPYVEAGAAITIPYADIDTTIARITEIAETPELVQEATARIAEMQLGQPSFDETYRQNVLSRTSQ